MIAALQFYQAYVSPFIRNGVPILAIMGLWVALRRAGLTPKARMTGIITTGLLLVWWVTIDQLARSGFYASYWSVMRPLCWAIAIAWLIPLTRSESIGVALEAIPPWWLIGLQFYRAGGGLTWFAALAAGRLPAGFALPAGIGDSLVGIFAVAVAVWVYSGARGGRAAGIAWNVFGLLDFAGGFVLASFLPYNFAYPGVMIPAFLAPLSLDLHALSLRQLMRAIKRAKRPAAVPVATVEAVG
jgi:hypothetical protein